MKTKTETLRLEFIDRDAYEDDKPTSYVVIVRQDKCNQFVEDVKSFNSYWTDLVDISEKLFDAEFDLDEPVDKLIKEGLKKGIIDDYDQVLLEKFGTVDEDFWSAVETYIGEHDAFVKFDEDLTNIKIYY